MKKTSIVMLAIFALATIMSPQFLRAQDNQDKKAQNDKDKVYKEANNAKEAFIKTDESMKGLFDNSYGYVIFPNIDKGALVVGGAGGTGVVYEKGKKVGTATIAQVNVGAQAGAQTYREVIFFENKGAFDRFKESKTEFSAQTSAVAASAGASANAEYTDGVKVFTQEISGLMLEASVGGQKFTFKPM